MAILTKAEYTRTQALSIQFIDAEEAQEAARIVADMFGSFDALGMLRIREHAALPPGADLVEFRTLMNEFFPARKRNIDAPS